MNTPVTWFEIIGKDAAASQAFYRNVFGWPLTPPSGAEMGHYSMLEDGGSGIRGGIGQAGDEGGPRVTIYIEVDDPSAYLNKVVQAGGTTLMPETQIMPDVTIAMFSDPDGHVMGLMKSSPSA